MQAIGGLVGITQNAETLALRPKVGWAIRHASKLDALMSRVSDEHVTCPVKPATPDETSAESSNQFRYLPPGLGRFYADFPGGASLFGSGPSAPYRILSWNQMKSLDWGEEPEIGNSRGPDGRTWYRFIDLADGSFLAIDLDLNRFRFDSDQNPDWSIRKCFSPICLCLQQTVGKAGANPIIANSFLELLERILDSGGKPFWQEPGFHSRGEADQFVRREARRPRKRETGRS